MQQAKASQRFDPGRDLIYQCAMDCPYEPALDLRTGRLPGPAGTRWGDGLFGVPGWKASRPFFFFDRPGSEAAGKLAGKARIRDEYRMSYLEWQGGQAVEPFQVGRLAVPPALGGTAPALAGG